MRVLLQHSFIYSLRRATVGVCVASSFLLILSLPAYAAPFTNGGFESGLLNPGNHFITLGLGSSVITGWTVTEENIQWTGSFWQAAEGLCSIDMDGEDGNSGSISQTFDTISGTTYQVVFAMAGNPGNAPVIKPLRVSAANISADYTFSVASTTFENMGYEDKLFIFTALSDTTTLTFTSLTVPSGWGAVIDNVRVNQIAVVPEPGTFALLGLGLLPLAVGLARRSKMRQRCP